MSGAPSGGPAIGRDNSIGFLRLLLASFVIYSHSYFLGGFGDEPFARWTGGTMIFGTIGVQCFFVLSGWLVTVSYQRSPSVWRFLWHRGLRLAPAMWLCLAVTALVFAPIVFATTPGLGTGYFALDPGPAGYVLKNLIRPRTQNFIGQLLAGNPWALDWNGSLWTLFYEGACYLLVAGVGLLGLLTRRRAVGLGILLGTIALYLLWEGLHPAWLPRAVGRLFDTPGKVLAVHFIAGMVWALLPGGATKWLDQTWVTLGFGALLVAGWHWRFHPLVTPLALAPVIFWLAAHLPLRSFEHRFGGDYSYGLYVYGYPVLQTLAHFNVHRAGLVVFGVTGFLLTAGLAVLSWRFVEKPALSLKSVAFPALGRRKAVAVATAD